jgi:acetaldehyde dehydrogenase/alcohol dehydrogenase
MPGKEAEFYAQVETLAEQAFDDQCTGSNPRYPLIQDLQELYILAYQSDREKETVNHQEAATKEEFVMQ